MRGGADGTIPDSASLHPGYGELRFGVHQPIQPRMGEYFEDLDWRPTDCPVCGAKAGPFAEVDGRAYWACETCEARFLDSTQRPSAQEELERYRQHRNFVDDPHYRQFLSKLAITCSETAEHFHDPADEFERLDRLLRPGGWLGLMTCFQTDDDRFADWHYRKDPTHVVFYRAATMRTIAAMHNWTCEIPAKDIALMHKKT